MVQPSSWERTDSSSVRLLCLKRTVVTPLDSSKSSSISVSRSASPSQVQVNARRARGSISIWRPPPVALESACGGAGDVGEGGVSRVRVGEVGYLIGHERTATAAALGPVGNAGLKEERQRISRRRSSSRSSRPAGPWAPRRSTPGARRSAPSSLRLLLQVLIDDIEQAPQRARWRSIPSAALSSALGSSESR